MVTISQNMKYQVSPGRYGSGGKSCRLAVWGLPVRSHPGYVEVSLSKTLNPQLLLTSWLVPCTAANCRWCVNVCVNGWIRGIHCTALWIKALYKCSPFNPSHKCETFHRLNGSVTESIKIPYLAPFSWNVASVQIIVLNHGGTLIQIRLHYAPLWWSGVSDLMCSFFVKLSRMDSMAVVGWVYTPVISRLYVSEA